MQIPTQRRPLPTEGDKPVRPLFMKFHFIPPWQPFKQWLLGNVPPRMSNNGRDQQLFCPANTLIKRVKIFLPESIKDRSIKGICKQEQKERQTKALCPNDATFVPLTMCPHFLLRQKTTLCIAYTMCHRTYRPSPHEVTGWDPILFWPASSNKQKLSFSTDRLLYTHFLTATQWSHVTIITR